MGSGSGRLAITTRSAKNKCAKIQRLVFDLPPAVGEMPARALINENDQANRAISTGKLHALLHFHTQPIDVVVSHGSQGKTGLEVGFPLRCFQRLSRPHIATLLCRWRDNRSTRDVSTPVLSY